MHKLFLYTKMLFPTLGVTWQKKKHTDTIPTISHQTHAGSLRNKMFSCREVFVSCKPVIPHYFNSDSTQFVIHLPLHQSLLSHFFGSNVLLIISYTVILPFLPFTNSHHRFLSMHIILASLSSSDSYKHALLTPTRHLVQSLPLRQPLITWRHHLSEPIFVLSETNYVSHFLNPSSIHPDYSARTPLRLHLHKY